MREFTLDEAEAILPRVRALLGRMQDAKRQIDALRVDLQGAVRTSTGNGHVRDERSLEAKKERAERLVAEINANLETLHEWGIELKSLDEGLIDFPHRRGGRLVYLCWRLGEDRIEYWHDIDAGFAGRQPL